MIDERPKIAPTESGIRDKTQNGMWWFYFLFGALGFALGLLTAIALQ